MAQGMEVALRQNIMIQFLYVINNMFRETQGVEYLSRDVSSLKVTTNINIKRVIIEGVKCD